MVGVVVGCLSSPVDCQVDLADLLERPGRVLQPRRHLAVAGMGADDRVDVAVEDGEASVVPLEHPALVSIGHRPAIRLCRLRCQRRADGVQAGPVRLHAGIAESRGVGDRIELEVVDVTVELELEHPVHQLARRDPGCRRALRMEFEQAAAGVADDPARVVSTSNHLDCARQCRVHDRVELCWIGARPRRFEYIDRPVHLAAVRVGRTPTAQIGPSPNQRKNSVGQRGHRDQQRTLRADRTPEVRGRDPVARDGGHRLSSAAERTRSITAAQSAGLVNAMSTLVRPSAAYGRTRVSTPRKVPHAVSRTDAIAHRPAQTLTCALITRRSWVQIPPPPLQRPW